MYQYLITKAEIVAPNYHYDSIFQHLYGRSYGVAFRQHQRRNGTVLLAAALVAVLVVVALAGTVSHAVQSGQVTVLNPESYPLVGGTWLVELDVQGGGVMTVSAVEGTTFGKDVEFAGLYDHGGAAVQIQPSVGHDGTVHFGNIHDGRWTFEVDVITLGPHHLRFEMGDNTAHADNTASLARVTSATADGAYAPT